MNTKSLPVLAGLLLALLAAAPAAAQDNLVALGRVNSMGTLIAGSSPLGAVATVQTATGVYEITVDAPGAFTGAGIGDFLVMATIRSATFTDRGIASRIVSVDPDALVVRIEVHDLENSAAPSTPVAIDASFQFVVHRFPTGTLLTPSSRFLYAAGRVASNGNAQGTVVADGTPLTVSRFAEGDYVLEFNRTGAFVGYGLEDFLVLVTSGSSLHVEDCIAAATADSKSADHLILTVNTADGQSGGDVAVADDNEFHFAVYRLGGITPGVPAESSLILGMASVQGSNGLLRRGALSSPGSVSAERTGTGRYRLVFSSPGRFAGRNLGDFACQVHVDNTAADDNQSIVRPMFLSADSLTVDVRINDLQTSGEAFGVAEDNDFYLMVHEAFATARPDLRVGKRAALTQMRGNDRYNTNSAGQRIRVVAGARGGVRAHAALQNDGNVTQPVRFRGKPGQGLRLTRCFRLAGSKSNVTAAFLTGGDLVPELRPSATVRYLIQSNLPPDSSKSRSKLRLYARPGFAGAPLDSAWAEIVR